MSDDLPLTASLKAVAEAAKAGEWRGSDSIRQDLHHVFRTCPSKFSLQYCGCLVRTVGYLLFLGTSSECVGMSNSHSNGRVIVYLFTSGRGLVHDGAGFLR